MAAQIQILVTLAPVTEQRTAILLNKAWETQRLKMILQPSGQLRHASIFAAKLSPFNWLLPPLSKFLGSSISAPPASQLLSVACLYAHNVDHCQLGPRKMNKVIGSLVLAASMERQQEVFL